MRAILACAGIDKDLQTAHLADWQRPARPPAHSVLANNRAAALGISLRPWRDALSEYVAGLTAAV